MHEDRIRYRSVKLDFILKMLITDFTGERNEIASHLGGNYSFVNSLLMGGTGSVRIVYQEGLSSFDEIASLDTQLPFCNFEIYKEGFSIQLLKKGRGKVLGIRFGDVREILFVTTPIRSRMRGRRVIRHKAVLVITLADCTVRFQVPQVYYSSFRRFLTKHFGAVVRWEWREAEDDISGNLINLLSKFFK